MKYLLFGLLFINTCFANVLTKQGKGYYIARADFSVEEIVQDYAQIQGYSLITDGKIKGKMSTFGPRKIKESELDLFVTSILSDTGYSILATDEIKQYEVINARDLRYKGGKVTTDILDVPETYNFYQYIMKLNYVDSYDFGRNLRPFISRYGRIIDEKNANTIILADTGKNIHRMHDLIKKLDTKDFLKSKEMINKINSESKREEVKNKSVLEYIKDQYILFLISFSLIGGILGFGTRGYLMKRIEGGW